MRYFDTGFLVPLVLPEATSGPVAGFFEDLPGDDLAVSDWTRVEFASLLARDDFNRAREWLSRFETGPRAGDALPLAIASNRAVEAVCTLDKVMIVAGRTLGPPGRSRLCSGAVAGDHGSAAVARSPRSVSGRGPNSIRARKTRSRTAPTANTMSPGTRSHTRVSIRGECRSSGARACQ